MIICGFCNAPWTEKMIIELDSINSGCETCGYKQEIDLTVIIECENCKRVIYKKECSVSH